MNTGDIVKFKNETAEEKEARTSGQIEMVVIWSDSPRAMVESRIDNMEINPTAIYNISELEIVS